MWQRIKEVCGAGADKNHGGPLSAEVYHLLLTKWRKMTILSNIPLLTWATEKSRKPEIQL